MKENYNHLPWHCREMIEHEYPLTDTEKLEIAERMANARAEALRLEEELACLKKAYKERIDMYAGEFSQAARQFKSGLGDPVDVGCDLFQDFEKLEMVYVAVESGEELKRRPMSEKEKRPSLFSSPPEGDVKITLFPRKKAKGD